MPGHGLARHFPAVRSTLKDTNVVPGRKQRHAGNDSLVHSWARAINVDVAERVPRRVRRAVDTDEGAEAVVAVQAERVVTCEGIQCHLHAESLLSPSGKY